ncbi:MAG: hypothetical protein KDA84_28850 [Planctomycetaceae bacterium]|nr:hypothetical protein [Planctomycetaceae bacterium]
MAEKVTLRSYPKRGREDIRNRIEELAEEVVQDHDLDEVVFVPILSGAFVFAGAFIYNLSKKLDELKKTSGLFTQIYEVKASSYEGTERRTIKIDELKLNRSIVAGRHVIILDDIFDTGQTVNEIASMVDNWGAKKVSSVVMLQKKNTHQEDEFPRKPDYRGFWVEQEFVVGFGLDYKGFCRLWGGVAPLTDDVKALIDAKAG